MKALRTGFLLCGTAMLAVSTVANAELIQIDTTNIGNFDVLGDLDNTTLTINVGPNFQIVGIGLDANVTTFGNSLVSQVGVAVADSGNTDVWAQLEGLGPNAPATDLDVTTGGIIPLSFLGVDPIVLTSNAITIEFYETFDNSPDIADSIWNSGTLTIEIQQIPAPGALAALSAFGLLARRKRRRNA